MLFGVSCGAASPTINWRDPPSEAIFIMETEKNCVRRIKNPTKAQDKTVLIVSVESHM